MLRKTLIGINLFLLFACGHYLIRMADPRNRSESQPIQKSEPGQIPAIAASPVKNNDQSATSLQRDANKRTEDATKKQADAIQRERNRRARREAGRARLREQIDLQFGRLYRELKLSTGQIDEIGELLVDRQWKVDDAFRAAKFSGINIGDPANWPNIINGAVPETENKIKTIFQPTHYAIYADYQATMKLRSALMPLENNLKALGHALSDEQYEKIITLVAELSPPDSLTTPIPESVSDSAARFLTSEQLHQLHLLQNQLNAYHEKFTQTKEALQRRVQTSE